MNVMAVTIHMSRKNGMGTTVLYYSAIFLFRIRNLNELNLHIVRHVERELIFDLIIHSVEVCSSHLSLVCIAN